MKFEFGGGGGGFGKPGGGGRRGGRAGGDKVMFSQSVLGVTELDGDKAWKAAVEEDSMRRNMVILFYDSDLAEFEDLKSAMTEFGRKLVDASGLVSAGVVSCGRQQKICEREGVKDLPSARYYGPEGEKPKRHPAGPISFKSLSTWIAKAMADYVKVLFTEKDVKRWLPIDDKVPHVVFFSDKKTTPPLMKTLSVEFKGRAALGVVLAVSEDLAQKMGVSRRPALVHVLDEDSLRGDNFDKEFKKESLTRFLSRCVGKHRSEAGATLRELTAQRFAAGDCGPSEQNFCLLLLSSGEDAASMASMRTLAQRLKRDPVKVFFVRDLFFSKAFGAARILEEHIFAGPGSVVLYRPKRKRFKLFSGETDNVDELFSWVDGAIGGGAPLPEKLLGTPAFKRTEL